MEAATAVIKNNLEKFVQALKSYNYYLVHKGSTDSSLPSSSWLTLPSMTLAAGLHFIPWQLYQSHSLGLFSGIAQGKNSNSRCVPILAKKPEEEIY